MNRLIPRTVIAAGETVTVSVEVTNVGERSADEVVQLYLHQRYGTASRPVRELKGFRRITVAAGESAAITFPVGPDQLRYWNAAERNWTIDATTIDVYVGGDSAATATTSFGVTRV